MDALLNDLPTVTDNWDDTTNYFLRYCSAKGLSPRTLEFYRQRITAFVRFCNTSPAETTSQTLRMFIIDEIESKSPQTAKHSWSVLSNLFKFLSAEGFGTNPMANISKPKVPAKQLSGYSLDDIMRLLDDCNLKTFTGVRDYAITSLFAECGLRAGEVCSIKLQDVDFKEYRILINGKGARERYIPITPGTAKVLTRYIGYRGELDSDLLFVTAYVTPFNPQTLGDVFEKRCKRLGITYTRILHSFRHFAAVSLIREGASPFSVQKLLGHSSLEMTKRYCAIADCDVSNAVNQFSPIRKLQEKNQPRKRLK